MPNITVDSIVAVRNKEPYVRLFVDDKPYQLSMAEARKVANDIVVQCSRAEADAMILRFFNNNEFPDGAAAALMQDFRDFRLALDSERPEAFYVDPDTGAKTQ